MAKLKCTILPKDKLFLLWRRTTGYGTPQFLLLAQNT
jgi:hypothetical protein